MRKLVITLVAALVVSGTAYGQSKTSTAPEKKQTKARALRDNQMDRVTAAGEEQEALAANNSHITETNSGTVNLSGSALMGAKGVNIVNESDALVANGVNVYNGSLTTVSNTGSADVDQSNDIDQSSRTEATLTNYKRGANSQLNVTSSSDNTKRSSSMSTLDASFSHTQKHTEMESHTNTKASTSNDTTESEDSSKSTTASLKTASSKSDSSRSVKSFHETANVEGAVSFDKASAQNIAVDGSTITATNTYSVILAGTAEQNATALNIVNAAGGMVANAVNVARTSNMNSTPTLTQSNSISQTR